MGENTHLKLDPAFEARESDIRCDSERKFRPTELMKIDGYKEYVFWLKPKW